MNRSRLDALLARFSQLHALVVGDFFLDRYLRIDESLAERSVETGLVAHQVVEVVSSPGAAGTVTSNLRALGVRVTPLGVIGDDGEGYELRRGLAERGVDAASLVVTPERRTPTYTKPIVVTGDAPPRELERLDIRTRAPLPAAAQQAIDAALARLAAEVDFIVIADQMPEAEHGVITARTRALLAEIAAQRPAPPILVDSRERIALFRGVIAKPNMREAIAAVFPGDERAPTVERARAAGKELLRLLGRPLFVTLGAEGMLAIEERSVTHVPAPPADGPIDIVGAGDSAMAAIGAALAAGASHAEAALLGNLAAAVTIRQIGTTGAASGAQIAAMWERLL
jgi:rfaE bifunctional protein kinase chain/domain